MKKFLLLFTFCVLGGFASLAQESKDYSADHTSPDVILKVLYDVISGPKGQERNWDRFRALFVEGARLMPTGTNAETGETLLRIWSPDEYVDFAGERLMAQGFYEVEIHRETEQYGPIMHCFSSYESRRDPSEEPFARGINSIQLFNDGARWWIVSIFWSAETPTNPLPEGYGGE